MARRIIKHANRRLYDSEQRRAITLHELYALVEGGESVIVELKETGEDITAETLLLSVLEHLRHNRGGTIGAGTIETMLAAVRGAVNSAARRDADAGARAAGGESTESIDRAAVALPARGADAVEVGAAEPSGGSDAGV